MDQKPNVSHLKVFCYVVFLYVSIEKRSKLDDKSTKCIFMRYSNEIKGSIFYDPITKKLIISCDIILMKKIKL